MSTYALTIDSSGNIINNIPNPFNVHVTSGKTLTIDAGASVVNNGTATGFDSGVTSFNTRTGDVTLLTADVNSVGPLTLDINGNATTSGTAGSASTAESLSSGGETFGNDGSPNAWRPLDSDHQVSSFNNSVGFSNVGFFGNGSGITFLNASNFNSGTMPTARLGSGTANSSRYLRGDSTWAILGSLAVITPTGTPSSTTFLKYDGTTYSWATPAGGGGGVTSFNTRTGAVTLVASDVPNVLNATTFGSTTTDYQSGNSIDIQYLDTNSSTSPGGFTASITSNWTPTSSSVGIQKINFSNAVFVGGTQVSGNLVLNRVTGTDRITNSSAMNSIIGYDTHIGNQSNSVGGTSVLTSVTMYYANSPLADASNPVTNSYGLQIDPQKITGVTNGYGINQTGNSDINVFNGPTTFGDGVVITAGSGTGLKFGGGTSQKIGFWGSTPVIQQSGDLLTALSTIGLVASPTIGGNDVNPAVCGSSSNVNNTTTDTFITNGTVKGNPTIPANKFVVGSTYRLTMMGYYSTTGTPTLNFIWGTYSSGLSLTFGSTGAQTMPLNASNLEWQAQYIFTVQSTGSSGTIIGQGWTDIQTLTTTVRYPMSNTSTVTVNTTSSNWLMGFVKWGTASSSNTITCTNAMVEQIY